MGYKGIYGHEITLIANSPIQLTRRFTYPQHKLYDTLFAISPSPVPPNDLFQNQIQIPTNPNSMGLMCSLTNDTESLEDVLDHLMALRGLKLMAYLYV